MKTIFLAWIGQNAYFGEANKNTGLKSHYGELFAFSTKENQAKFCNTYCNRNNSYPFEMNQKEARSKFLGMTIADYNNYLAEAIDMVDDALRV